MSIEQPSTKTNSGSDEQRGSTTGWLQTLRARLGLPGSQNLRETLEAAITSEGEREGTFSAQEREMLLRLLRFGAMRVDDVMVPRADIIAADESETVAEVLATFVEAGVSRIPLFHETLDDPRGMVHVKDLLGWLAGGVKTTGTPAPPPAAIASEAATGVATTGVATTGVATTGGVAVVTQPPEVVGQLTRALGAIELNSTIAATKLRRTVLYVPP